MVRMTRLAISGASKLKNNILLLFQINSTEKAPNTDTKIMSFAFFVSLISPPNKLFPNANNASFPNNTTRLIHFASKVNRRFS